LAIEGQAHNSPHFVRIDMKIVTFQLHIIWNNLGLGTMFTQLDDDGKKFMVAYVIWSNTMNVKYNSYGGECLAIVWVVSSLKVIYTW
jgi:hypothetical protein